MDKERKGAAGDIYGNMEMTQARMAELLDRDSFVPTLPAVPDADTLTYTDTGGIVRNFRIGQQCRVADAESDQGYTFYQLYALEGGKAVWAGAGSGTGDVREKVTVTLTSNQAQPDNALKGAVVKVAGTDGASYFEGPWTGEPIRVKVPPQIDYVVSVSAVEGYATPAQQQFTSAIQGERQVELVYNACVLTVRVASNQADTSDVAGATATVAYGDQSVTVKDGQSVKVPLGASVTVTASQVDKYQTPAVQRLTPQVASQTVTLIYNTCVLTVQVSGLQHSEPVTASVKYSSVTEQVQPGGSVKVPYGVSVTVSVSEVVGYAKPSDVVFTPNQPTHTASFEYVASAVRVTIDSNQPDKNDLRSLKATLSYAGHTEQVASGQQVGIPTGTQITLSFPDVAGYRKPGNIVFTNSGGLVEKTGTYLTEVVKVTLNADNGQSMAGQTVTINSQQFTWQGTEISKKIPHGTQYSVSVNEKDDYIAPEQQTFTAGQVSRSVTMQYKYNPIKSGYFILDDTVKDPATKITQTPDGEKIVKWIRENSHRVLAKKIAEGKCRVIKLMDNDTTKYFDGQSAPITDTNYDVMMMMPEFWYATESAGTDKWKIWLTNGDPKDGKKWKKWDHGHLIGVYEAYVTGNKMYSVSGYTSSGSISQADFKQYARNKGKGYMAIDWQAHCVMAALFWAYNKNTNCQKICGSGTSNDSKTTGQTNKLGMADTTSSNGNSMSINFWGLENWWGNKLEFVDNAVVDDRQWKVIEPNGVVRIAGTGCSYDGYISKLIIGEFLDIIPKKADASDSTGHCDYYYQSTLNSRVVLRSDGYSNSNGGVSCAFASNNSSGTHSSNGSRLAFIGEIVEASSVSEFLA